MNCTTCARYAGSIIDRRILCRLFGPVAISNCCKKYIEQISEDRIIYGKKCQTCKLFLPDKSLEWDLSMRSYKRKGSCLRYGLKNYDGARRNACSKYEEA